MAKAVSEREAFYLVVRPSMFIRHGADDGIPSGEIADGRPVAIPFTTAEFEYIRVPGYAPRPGAVPLVFMLGRGATLEVRPLEGKGYRVSEAIVLAALGPAYAARAELRMQWPAGARGRNLTLTNGHSFRSSPLHFVKGVVYLKREPSAAADAAAGAAQDAAGLAAAVRAGPRSYDGTDTGNNEPIVLTRTDIGPFLSWLYDEDGGAAVLARERERVRLEQDVERLAARIEELAAAAAGAAAAALYAPEPPSDCEDDA
jgi:hypothetical protein